MYIYFTLFYDNIFTLDKSKFELLVSSLVMLHFDKIKTKYTHRGDKFKYVNRDCTKFSIKLQQWEWVGVGLWGGGWVGGVVCCHDNAGRTALLTHWSWNNARSLLQINLSHFILLLILSIPTSTHATCVPNLVSAAFFPPWFITPVRVRHQHIKQILSRSWYIK